MPVSDLTVERMALYLGQAADILALALDERTRADAAKRAHEHIEWLRKNGHAAQFINGSPSGVALHRLAEEHRRGA